MPNKGQKAAVLCDAGSNIIYTADHGGGDELISITFASIDNTPVTMKVYHVKQGNAGTVPVGDKVMLSSPLIIVDRPVILRDLQIATLDDIIVNADLAGKLAVTVNSRNLT